MRLQIVPRFPLSSGASLALAALLVGPGGAVSRVPEQDLPIYTLREEWRIVSDESSRDMQLTSVTGITVLPDGRVVTSHRSENMLRVFDSAGRFVRTVGRRGQGPGEFSSLAGVGFAGDTIWVRDGPLWELFNRDFVPIGQLPAPATSGQFIGVMSGGKTFAVIGSALTDSRSVAIGGALGPPGTARAIPVRGVSQMLDVVYEGTRQTIPGPLRTLAWVALAPGGRDAVVIEPARLWNGQPGQFTIRRLTPAWRLSAAVTVSLTSRRMSRQKADSAIANWARLRSFGPDVQRKVEVPEYLDAFVSVEYFADGLLWMSYEDVRGDTRLVVGVDGRPRMRVRVPPGFNAHHATSTHVWATLLDANDLPIIVRYRLQPPR